MTHDVPPANPVSSAAQRASWLHRSGAILSEAAAISAPVLPGGGWDELTWAYARAFREVEEASQSSPPPDLAA